MHIIFTHDNADFDAVASLLSVWLLNPEAIPVLPNRLNRNVRDFVTLYENQLPFIYSKELDTAPITHLTIVDSQYVPSLEQLTPETSVHIIDHHELQTLPPPATILSIAETGANVTQLVEKLRQISFDLSPIEATLLMLGIYEDTGSLTYSNTTVRDMLAATWLLAEGLAHLDMLREYLNYAMSDAQRLLYDQLAGHLETYLIHGHTIMIGAAKIDYYVEEISDLAHQLRDLYQPEAIFILIEMKNHIQLVARSTTSAIDVARVAEFFKGGGHPRAAASMIKAGDLEQVKRNLRRLLMLEIQPAVTVAEIMSENVRTLAPTDTLQEAIQLLERYGDSGFPVVDRRTHKVLGVISRREIDKARHHQLEAATIEQFMIKGEFFVNPTDSTEVAHRLMVEQGIGQVPVFHPTEGKVVGVVTRTDLINLWGVARREKPQNLNLRAELAQSLSPQLLKLLREAGELAVDQGDTLYLVGGFVRDLVLSTQSHNGNNYSRRPHLDLDLVVEGDAIALAQRLADEQGGQINSHRRFGTAKWTLAHPIPFAPGLSEENVSLTSLDFATARIEFYDHPSALPDVEESTIRQDLHRRDFTINTLALALTSDHFGQLLDLYDGQADLADAYRFRTPSLRNVAQTAPYGHSGAYATLEGVLRHHLDPVAALNSYDPAQAILPNPRYASDFAAMSDAEERARIADANTLAPIELSDAQIADLLAFLVALSDPQSLSGRLGIPKTVPSGLPVDH